MKKKLAALIVLVILPVLPIKMGEMSIKITDELRSMLITKEKIFSHIREIAKEHKVNPALVAAIVHAESSFNPMAVSRSGAKGLMQINDITARHLNLKDVFNPKANIYAGVMYLKELRGRFGNNINLIAAAYNAGPGAVKKYSGIPPYSETRKYVVKVVKFYHQYNSKKGMWI